MNSKKLKKKLGQNTAEYLIMLVLVAVGSIGLFSIFGQTLRHQLGQVTHALQGTGSGVKGFATTTTIDDIVKEGNDLNFDNKAKSSTIMTNKAYETAVGKKP